MMRPAPGSIIDQEIDRDASCATAVPLIGATVFLLNRAKHK